MAEGRASGSRSKGQGFSFGAQGPGMKAYGLGV